MKIINRVVISIIVVLVSDLTTAYSDDSAAQALSTQDVNAMTEFEFKKFIYNQVDIINVADDTLYQILISRKKSDLTLREIEYCNELEKQVQENQDAMKKHNGCYTYTGIGVFFTGILVYIFFIMPPLFT